MSNAAYDKLQRWRDIGNVPATYCAGSKDFGDDVITLLAQHAEMLAALKDITRFCDAVRVQVGMGKTQLARLEQARAAIAKAEGRS